MALVTTFLSSPLTMYFYPVWYQKKVEAFRRGEIDWDTDTPRDASDTMGDGTSYDKVAAQKVKHLTVYLRLDSMPTLLAFTSLFGGQSYKPTGKVHPSIEQSSTSVSKDETSGVVKEEEEAPKRPVEAYGLRLINLTDRGSSVMAVSEAESYSAYDPVVNTFRAFGRLHNLAVSGEVLVVPESSFADTISTRASESDLLLLPWSETGGMSEQNIIEDKGTKNKLAAHSYVSFINQTLEQSTIPVAILINKNFGGSKNKPKKDRTKLHRTISSVSIASSRNKDVTAPIADRSHHIFFPYFGGDDDRTALRLVLQLAENPEITATIVRFEIPGQFHSRSRASSTTTAPPLKAVHATVAMGASVMSSEEDAACFASLSASVPAEMSSRVVFQTVVSDSPLQDVIARAGLELGQNPKNAGDLIVLGRNLANNSFVVNAKAADADEIRSATSVSSSLGVLSEKIWESKFGASVLVVKAGRR